MLARCPNCRETFSTDRTGLQDCPHCRKPLVVPGAAPEAPPQQPSFVPPQAGGPEPGGGGTPWERRDRLGAFEAWKQTVWQALFEPGKLFESARLDRGPAQLGFAVLTGGVFSIIGQLLERALFAGQREQVMKMIESVQREGAKVPPFIQKMLTQSAESSWAQTILIALLAPAFVFILVYLNAAVTHGFALLLGQARRGFPATFAAATYSLAPLVLLVIPGCGSLAALIWIIVLTGVGLKITHGIGSGGAAAVALAPYLILCCGGCAVAIAAGAAFSRMGGG